MGKITGDKGSKQRAPRPDKTEFIKRLMHIQTLMVDGMPSALIADQIIKKKWAKSERHAFILMEKARNRWIQYEDNKREEKRKMQIISLRSRVRSMSKKYKATPEGLRVMLQYEKEIAKLEGLYYLHGTDLEGDQKNTSTLEVNFNNISFKPGEVAEIAAQLESKY